MTTTDDYTLYMKWLAGALQPYWPPPQPFPLAVTPISRSDDMQVYKLTLPAPGAADVVQRKLTEIVNGASRTFDATDDMELKFQDDAEVELFLVDVDDAGNASAESPHLKFTVRDTLAPPAPGELGLAFVREE